MTRPAATACTAYYIIEMSLGLSVKPWGRVNIKIIKLICWKLNGIYDQLAILRIVLLFAN